MTHRPDYLVFNRGRRRFLAGAAGLLALPFLESLGGFHTANAWTPAPGQPKRLILFFHGHGTIMEAFTPNGQQIGPILQPIADANLMSKVSVVSGINSKVEGGHSGAASVFTCTPVIPNQYGITHATTPSIDHIIARHMQDGGPAKRLDLGVANESLDMNSNGISRDHTQTYWSGDNELLDTHVRPDLVFDRVFPGAPTEPVTQPTKNLLTVRRRSVLDGVLKQFGDLEGRVSSNDRLRLQAHAEKIREIEGSLSDTTDVPVSQSCAAGPSVSFANMTHKDVAEIQVDVLAQAMACNLADVGSFKIFDLEEAAWGHVNHPDLAATFAGENYHGAWHKASDQNLDYARRAFTAVNTWYGELFARLLMRLDAIDEGDGTALDNSMVVWFSDFGHGGGHGSDNLHLVLAGNANGATLGRHINYAAQYNADPNSPNGNELQPGNHNLAVTMAQAFGINGNSFGDYTAVRQPVSPGPLDLTV